MARQKAEPSLGRRFSNCWFRTYRPQNDVQQYVLGQVRRWATDAAARQRYPFLILHGSPGLGKTHLLAAAWKQIARTQCIGRFINEGVFVSEWQRSHDNFDRPRLHLAQSEERSYGQQLSTNRPAELIQELQETSVLIVDDLGKARPTDAWMAALYQIIDARYANCRPTLLSTNYAPNELAGRIQPGTADRVLDGLTYTLTGSSMRGIAA